MLLIQDKRVNHFWIVIFHLNIVLSLKKSHIYDCGENNSLDHGLQFRFGIDEQDSEKIVADMISDSDNNGSLNQDKPLSPNKYSNNEYVPNKDFKPKINYTSMKHSTFKSILKKKKMPYMRNESHEGKRSNNNNNNNNHSFQEEILNSFLPLECVADNLHKTVVFNEKIFDEFKRGLCTEYVQMQACSRNNCPWSHEPATLFRKRLDLLPNLDIINLILSMQNDQFYTETLTEGFKELIFRKVPDKWIQVLIFYVFTKTESISPNFFEFWDKTAKYFCITRNFNNISLGFVELINIFSGIKHEDRSRVIKFIEMIKSPPFGIKITYQLLKPILHFNLSFELLIEAVESCVETGLDLLDVRREIVSKINVQYVSLHGIETFLKYLWMIKDMPFRKETLLLKSKLHQKILSLPSEIDKSKYPLTASYFQRYSASMPDEVIYKNLISAIIEKLTTEFDFQYFTEKINEVNEKFVHKAAEAIVNSILSLKLPPKDTIELMEICIYNSKTKSSETIIASLAVTLIFDYVTQKSDWETPCTILKLCDKKNIPLAFAKLVWPDPEIPVSQAVLMFLLAEVYMNNKHYEEFVHYLERYHVLSTSFSAWTVAREDYSCNIRSRLVNTFFKITFSEKLGFLSYKFFYQIYKSQNSLEWPTDLRLYADDLIVTLINERDKACIEVFNYFDKKNVLLKPTTVRSLLIYMMQENYAEEAKNLFVHNAERIYKLPRAIESNSIFEVKIESTWSEEEILLLFNYYFLKFKRKRFGIDDISEACPANCRIYVTLKMSVLEHDLAVIPYCVMEVDNSESAIISRVQNVLETKMVPPLKTKCMSKIILIEPQSMYNHLYSLVMRRS